MVWYGSSTSQPATGILAHRPRSTTPNRLCFFFILQIVSFIENVLECDSFHGGGSGNDDDDFLEEQWQAQQAILAARQGGGLTKEGLQQKYKPTAMVEADTPEQVSKEAAVSAAAASPYFAATSDNSSPPPTSNTKKAPAAGNPFGVKFPWEK